MLGEQCPACDTTVAHIHTQCPCKTLRPSHFGFGRLPCFLCGAMDDAYLEHLIEDEAGLLLPLSQPAEPPARVLGREPGPDPGSRPVRVAPPPALTVLAHAARDAPGTAAAPDPETPVRVGPLPRLETPRRRIRGKQPGSPKTPRKRLRWKQPPCAWPVLPAERVEAAPPPAAVDALWRGMQEAAFCEMSPRDRHFFVHNKFRLFLSHAAVPGARAASICRG